MPKLYCALPHKPGCKHNELLAPNKRSFLLTKGPVDEAKTLWVCSFVAPRTAEFLRGLAAIMGGEDPPRLRGVMIRGTDLFALESPSIPGEARELRDRLDDLELAGSPADAEVAYRLEEPLMTEEEKKERRKRL